MADRVVAPLRVSRQPLVEGLAQLQLAAEGVTSAETPVALAALETALEYLHSTLLPVMQAEEFTLYIAIDGLYGSTNATDVMKVQHGTIQAMAGDLRQVVGAAKTDEDVAAYARYLVPLLHGLYALIRAHLEAEDDVYLALLDDRASESQVGVIVDNIERIATARRSGSNGAPT